MSMRLASAPRILGWMTKKNQKFRRDAARAIAQLPEFSFLDKKTFVLHGYFAGDNVGSVVAKVSDKSGTYVAKSAGDARITTEVAFLKKWREVGAHTVRVVQLIKRQKGCNTTIVILEYIASPTTESIAGESPRKMLRAYRELGTAIAGLAKAKGTGFGEPTSRHPYRGPHKTFGSSMRAYFTEDRIGTLRKAGLYTDEDAVRIQTAIRIIESDMRRLKRPTLIHADAGLFNSFGLSPIVLFDPNPFINHPAMDLAIALIYATFEKGDAKMRNAVLRGYHTVRRDPDLVRWAAVYLRLYTKWWWWLYRAKAEKAPLRWIKKTTPLMREARKHIEKSATF